MRDSTSNEKKTFHLSKQKDPYCLQRNVSKDSLRTLSLLLIRGLKKVLKKNCVDVIFALENFNFYKFVPQNFAFCKAIK